MGKYVYDNQIVKDMKNYVECREKRNKKALCMFIYKGDKQENKGQKPPDIS